VTKFVSDLCGFLMVLRFPSPKKVTVVIITEILLEVALMTIPPIFFYIFIDKCYILLLFLVMVLPLHELCSNVKGETKTFEVAGTTLDLGL
jgi:hypothetical protein